MPVQNARRVEIRRQKQFWESKANLQVHAKRNCFLRVHLCKLVSARTIPGDRITSGVMVEKPNAELQSRAIKANKTSACSRSQDNCPESVRMPGPRLARRFSANSAVSEPFAKSFPRWSVNLREEQTASRGLAQCKSLRVNKLAEEKCEPTDSFVGTPSYYTYRVFT